MKLKVVKYKNYGCMMESEESEDPFSNNFFWCFFELNNKEIINLQLVENLKNNKIIDIDYEFYYAKEELKTGQVHEYKFGKAKPNTREFSNEFFEWFNNLSPIKDLKENTNKVNVVKMIFYLKRQVEPDMYEYITKDNI
jgi:hypothetical protein